MRSRRFERGGNWIEVSPPRHGTATVHDRDVLIYCISQCMAALNDGRKVQRKLRFKAYDLLVATNRQMSGRGYELLKDAFRRLQGAQKCRVSIRNLAEKCGSASSDKEFRRMFGIIIEDDSKHNHMPDYSFLIEDDNAVVRRKDGVVEVARDPEHSLPVLSIEPETLAAARAQAPGWDVYQLESEWRAWVVAKGITLKDPDRHFLSFCRRRGPAG